MRHFDQEWQLLVSARTWLLGRGLRLVDSRGPEGMDQGVNVYAGDRLGIRFTADRSQWFVDIRPSSDNNHVGGSDDWFSLEAWSTCLGAQVLFHDARPTLTDQDWKASLANSWWLQPQLDYLRDYISAIEQACAPERVEATRACLSEAQPMTAWRP